jgi:hypothetical protein
MESWDDGRRIKSSMEVILELEARASASVQAMPGLPSLLAFLRDSGVRVGLVTRNTTQSLNAFFDGEPGAWKRTGHRMCGWRICACAGAGCPGCRPRSGVLTAAAPSPCSDWRGVALHV